MKNYAPGDGIEANGNPILPFEAADPHLVFHAGRFYLYATKLAQAEPGFAVWSSPDLVSWHYDGMALRLRDVSWAQKDDWAPAVVECDGQFFLFFCADSQIGVAVADSPVGLFRDALGAPLVPFRRDLSAIDPCALVDDDGRAFLYFGAVPAFWLDPREIPIATALSVRPLAPDMTSFDGPEAPTISYEPFSGKMNDFGPGHGHSLDHVEASFVFKRRGIYYLMFSRGNHGMDDDAHAYRVRYATSRSPLGPWQVAPEVVLQTRREVGCVGPGHHAVVELPGDRWLVAYHAHSGDGVRRVWLDWMEFDADGRILPIVPTREGVGRVRPFESS